MRALMLILVLATLQFAAAYESEGVLDITFVNQDPDPVEPGQYVDIRFKITNLGTEPITGIELELLPDFPFSLDPGEEAEKKIALLDPLQKADAGFILKYKVRVDSNAVEGTNTIRLSYMTSRGTPTMQEFDIDVQTLDANLGIVSVDTNPETVLPGTGFDLTIKVKNLADSTLRDVSIKLDTLLDSISGGSSATTKSEILDAVPFAPVKSATEKRIRNIEPGDEVIFSYSLIAYPDAAAKVYKIPLQVSYADGLGNSYSKNDVVGILVSAEPDLSVVLEESGIDRAASEGVIVVSFINKGLTDVKFVDVILRESSAYDIRSAREVYIGNIDSDDYETADYALYVYETNATSVPLLLEYDYMDANNNPYSGEKTLELRLCREGDPGCANGRGSGWTAFAVLIAVAAAAFLIWRMLRKKKNAR